MTVGARGSTSQATPREHGSAIVAWVDAQQDLAVGEHRKRDAFAADPELGVAVFCGLGAVDAHVDVVGALGDGSGGSHGPDRGRLYVPI